MHYLAEASVLVDEPEMGRRYKLTGPGRWWVEVLALNSMVETQKLAGKRSLGRCNMCLRWVHIWEKKLDGRQSPGVMSNQIVAGVENEVQKCCC